MKTPDVDVDQVKRLLELVDSHGLEELTIEDGDVAITVKGRGAATQVVPTAATAEAVFAIESTSQLVHAVEELPEEPPEEEEQGNIIDIVAPLVGVFYRAPSPDADAFVEVGDAIEVGTEVGLIEAMKVFSPIPSEVAGVIVDIPGQNGKLVQQGDVLFRVRVGEEETQ